MPVSHTHPRPMTQYTVDHGSSGDNTAASRVHDSTKMVPDYIEISSSNIQQIYKDLDKCMQTIQGTARGRSKDSAEKLHIIYRVSDLNTRLTTLQPEKPSQCCNSEDDFWSRTQKDDRYIALSNENQADMYVTNISCSIPANFRRLNVLNIVKTWTIEDAPWRCMSNTNAPFIIEQDKLALQPTTSYNEMIRVKLNDILLPQAVSVTCHQLCDQSRITVEGRPYDDDPWVELFTITYVFKDKNYITEKAEMTEYLEVMQLQVESSRMELESCIANALTLTKTMENKMKICEFMENEIGEGVMNFELFRFRPTKSRWRRTNNSNTQVYTR